MQNDQANISNDVKTIWQEARANSKRAKNICGYMQGQQSPDAVRTTEHAKAKAQTVLGYAQVQNNKGYSNADARLC
jgi:hypothetical protein